MPWLLLFCTLDLKENCETIVEKNVLILAHDSSSGIFCVSMQKNDLHQLTDRESKVGRVKSRVKGVGNVIFSIKQFWQLLEKNQM